ncbi:hypothetical protein BDL97_09G021200 [Sphagnum fallax]|nr:hypothetical protein BDL97_09G021200 [Sphagnum fallax]
MHQSLPFISLVPINKPSHSSLHRFAACCCLSSLPDHHRTGFVSVLGAGLGLGFHRSPEYAEEGWKKKLLPSPPLAVVFFTHGFQKWNRHGRRICYRKKFLWGSGGNVLGLGFSPAPAAAWEEKKKMSSSYDRQKMPELLLQQKAFSSLSETGREEEEQQQQPWKAAKLAELDDGSRSISSSCDGGGREEEDKEAGVGRKWKTQLLQRVRKEAVAAAAVGDDGGFDEAEEKNRMTAEERLELFEDWAATKISKEGQGAVAIIQEMRQALAPGSQPVSSSRDLDSSAISFESSQKSGGSSSKTRVALTVETRADAAEEKETSNNNCRSSEEGDKGTENVPFSSLSCNEREKDNAEKARGLQKETHPAAYSSSVGVFPQRTNPSSMVRFIETLRTNPQLLKLPKEKDPLTGLEQRPIVVKRNAKVPEDWDGPGGTVVLIDKPKGWTSFAVCSRIRHMLGIKKVGHAGTLDPMATGLLIVCVGKATKLADSYQAMTKVYSGTMRLGEYTPSYDADTEVTKTLPWEHIQDSHIMGAKQAFIGDIMQVPPMFSAIKVGGERLYKKARRGEEISVPPRPVTIYDFHLERNSVNRQDLDFVVICSKGTYVRTLCADLGQALDSYAHLTALRREKIGNLNVEDAWSVADVADHCNKLSSMQLQPTQD